MITLRMPKIILETKIHASIEICFDLSRSIDLHTSSLTHTSEQAVAGKTSGLIDLGETVTWKATHFGITQKLTSKITKFDRPVYFQDQQVSGAFHSFSHDHIFTQEIDCVVMKDVFNFESPFGYAGRIFNGLVLTDYLRRLLIKRNNFIKLCAERKGGKEFFNS